MYVIVSVEPENVPASPTTDARLVWTGTDDRSIEREIVAEVDDAARRTG